MKLFLVTLPMAGRTYSQLVRAANADVARIVAFENAVLPHYEKYFLGGNCKVVEISTTGAEEVVFESVAVQVGPPLCMPAKLAQYVEVAKTSNLSFIIQPGGTRGTSTMIREIREWMEDRQVSVHCVVFENGICVGSKNPIHDAGLSPEEFKDTVQDLFHFLCGGGSGSPPYLIWREGYRREDPSISGAIILPLTEGYGPAAVVHSAKSAWRFLVENFGEIQRRFDPWQCTLLRGAGESVGTRAEPGLHLELDGETSLAHAMTIACALASALNQPRFYIEYADQISVFERPEDRAMRW